MNTRRPSARRDKEGIANVGEQDNQVPQLEEVAMGDHVPVAFLSILEGDIREVFLQMSQSITTQAQAVTTQAQAMMAQANS